MTPKQLKWEMAKIVYQTNLRLEAERKAEAEKAGK